MGFVDEVRVDFIPNAGIVSLYILVGALANLTVIFIYVTRMRRTLNRRYFIPYLACVDFISCVFNGLSNAITKIYFFNFKSAGACKFVRFFGTFLVLYSGLLLLAIAVQRYLTICTKRSNFIDNRRKQLLIIILIPSSLFSVPRLIFPDATSLVVPNTNETVWMCDYSPGYRNSVELSVYKYILMVILFTVVGVMSVMYFLIMKRIIQSNKKTKQYKLECNSNLPQIAIDNESLSSNINTSELSDVGANGQQIPSSKPSEKQQPASTPKKMSTSKKTLQRRLCIIFMSISIVTVVTYLPRLAVETMDARNKLLFVSASSAERIILVLMSSLYISHGAINPFIYGLCDNEFRKNLKNVLMVKRNAPV